MGPLAGGLDWAGLGWIVTTCLRLLLRTRTQGGGERAPSFNKQQTNPRRAPEGPPGGAWGRRHRGGLLLFNALGRSHCDKAGWIATLHVFLSSKLKPSCLLALQLGVPKVGARAGAHSGRAGMGRGGVLEISKVRNLRSRGGGAVCVLGVAGGSALGSLLLAHPLIFERFQHVDPVFAIVVEVVLVCIKVV